MNELTAHNPTDRQGGLGFHDFGARRGRPIIFLHGANQTGASWRDIAALLPDHRAICFDLPGTGRNRHRPFNDLDTCADAVATAMRAQFPGLRLPIAGISLGAYVGLLLALRHPELVASATLSGFQIAPLKDSRCVLLISAVLSSMMTRYSFRKRAARAMGIPASSAAWPAPIAPCSARTLRRINRAAVRFDVRNALPRLQVPVLALAGDEETEPIRNALPQICAVSAMARAAMVPGGHAWPAARPNLFTRILMSWIEDGALPEDADIRIVGHA